MRYAVYVAAAAAIGLLIGFVTLSIGWLRKNVMHSIRNKTLSLLDTYDDLLEEKSRELSRLERELSEKEKALAAQQSTKQLALEETAGVYCGKQFLCYPQPLHRVNLHDKGFLI